MGLHSASDGGGDPDEEEEEEGLSYPEAPGQGPPHTAEEPIKRLPAGQDFQYQPITVTAEKQLICLWTRVFPWKQEADCDELVTRPPSSSSSFTFLYVKCCK